MLPHCTCGVLRRQFLSFLAFMPGLMLAALAHAQTGVPAIPATDNRASAALPHNTQNVLQPGSPATAAPAAITPVTVPVPAPVTPVASGAATGLPAASKAHGSAVPLHGPVRPAKPPASAPTSGAAKVANEPKLSDLLSRPLPRWNDLTPQQRLALAPLAQEWNQLGPVRRDKWLQIANKFPKMKPDEQSRLQEKMRDWTKLTPEQRKLARENYTNAKKIDPNQKSEKWQQYQQLPDDKKKAIGRCCHSEKTGRQFAASAEQNQTNATTAKGGATWQRCEQQSDPGQSGDAEQ